MKRAEIIDIVKEEKLTPHRFPSRVVFVKNWGDYVALVNDLRNVCDVTINLAKYAVGDNVPKFKTLKQELLSHASKTILLLSFGEYLRLCPNWERDANHGEFKRLWGQIQSVGATTKYVIPLFGGRELFDNAVTYVDERQVAFLWESTESTHDTDIKITVYSPDFADVLQVDAGNFSEWLSNWDKLFTENRSSFSLRTKLFRYTNGTLGNVRIEVVNDPFSYIASLMSDGDSLKKEYGSDQFWRDVVKSVQPHKPFSATIDYALNTGHSFDPVRILSQFDRMTETERLLFLLRYKMYPSNDYISYAVAKTRQPNEIPLSIRDSIFVLVKPNDKQLSERLKAISILAFHYEDGYFNKLDAVLPVESRLAYLSYKTAEERAYAVKTVSELLRKGAELDSIAVLLKENYPSLAEYLHPSIAKKDDTAAYFSWYRKNKLMNRVHETVPPVIDLDVIDSRNKVIQNSEAGYPLWIDGLGAEWLYLLKDSIDRELKRVSIVVNTEYKIARSMLPSETEYNHQWSKGDEKWDRLDKLSHNGTPDDKDYFSCIAMQIEYIGDIARRVAELLAENNCVVVTGDHGSSRLAALMFHVSENYAITPPEGGKVCSFGRFCELPLNSEVSITPSMETVAATKEGLDMKCVVMKTYEHFKQSGDAAGGNTDDNSVVGEVHGGMTPEEHLVPVLIVKRKTALEVIAQSKRQQVATKNELGI